MLHFFSVTPGESLHGFTISERFHRVWWKKHQFELIVRLQPLDVTSLFIWGVAKTHCLLLESVGRCTDWAGVFCTAVPKAPWSWSCYRKVPQVFDNTHGTEVEWHREHRLFYCRKQGFVMWKRILFLFFKIYFKVEMPGKRKGRREMESWLKRVLNQSEENYWLFISGHCIWWGESK